jgi:hypothetical protein
MYRFAALLVAGFLVFGGVITAPPPVDAAGCPPVPTTVAQLAAFNGGGATWDPSRSVRCLGDRVLTLRAFVARPDGIGGVRTWAISPAWFEQIRFWAFALFDTARTHDHAEIRDYRRYGDGAFIFVVAPLANRTLKLLLKGREQYHPLAPFQGRWVVVRGHFDDPAARRCRITRALFAPPPDVPTRAEIVQSCRATFVLDSVVSLSVPATATELAEPFRAGRGSVPHDVRLPVIGGAGCMALLLLLARPRQVRRRRGRGGAPW